MYGANSRADEEADGFDGAGVGAGLGAGDGDGAGLAALAVVMETELDCPEVPAESMAATVKL
jgi:hypothetical protein